MRLRYSITFAAIFASSSAFADIYIPEGESGTVLHLNSDFQVVDRITGLDNVHGMGGAPGRGILVTGSLTEKVLIKNSIEMEDRIDMSFPTIKFNPGTIAKIVEMEKQAC